MDRPDRSRMIDLTSSVTATMSSPKVVLTTFRCCMVFPSTFNPRAYLFAVRLVDIDIYPFASVVVKGRHGKLCARPIDLPKPFKIRKVQILCFAFRKGCDEGLSSIIGTCRNVGFSSDERRRNDPAG